ncbi:MAG: ATP-dependent RecD-like DNA helicase [Desulfovibrio sp.]|nr:ATP-dependent RecD-like DNA helicase [Desulfovibrio sp.]
MTTTTLERLKGQVERITYTSEETGYTVARVRVSGRQELVTVVGTLSNVTAGEVLLMSGEWTSHPKFGEQFKIAFYQCAVPATVKGIEKYLGSGLVKGIGPKMAKRIVKIFGEQTFQVIEEHPEDLAKVEGIGSTRITMITKAWAEQKEIREVMVFLQSHGVSATYATKIFKHYGSKSIAVVQENPYRLAYDIYGIGFLTADKIAAQLGFALDSPLRAEAGVLYTVQKMMDEGHVFVPFDKLLSNSSELLKIEDTTLLRQAVDRLKMDRRLWLDPGFWGQTAVPAVYLTGYHVAEEQSAQRILNLLHSASYLREVDEKKAVAWAEEKTGLKLAAKQREAVFLALREKMLIITGGPGTGKSTLLNAILTIYGAMGIKILLAAPTGRAAKRMSEVTGFEAKTIHRLLAYDFKKGGFRKNEEDQLDCDLLVLDEVSMVDQLLMHHLLKAVPTQAKCILVGDINQLPSVGAGAVLSDLMRSGQIPFVRLTEIFRQAQSSTIITGAHAIIQGRQPQLTNRENDDMFFIEEADPKAVCATIVGLVQTRLPKKYGFEPKRDIQVLSPMNRGTVGAHVLNAELQAALNPKGNEVSRGTRIFREGDKVMQIRNNYDKDVFNGDIGLITKVDSEEQVVKVEIDGRTICYDYQDLDELVLAYAISIHKSQGGEYPAVVIPITTQHYVMLQRNLLYTGITRGKKIVVLVGTRKALGLGIRNIQQQRRFTALAERLQEHKAQEQS